MTADHGPASNDAIPSAIDPPLTGRDVDETDYPLAFDPQAGAWRVLDGRAEDYLMRGTRSMVLRYLRDYPGQRPKQIAEALDLDPATVRQTCRRMADDGQLRATTGGQYRPAGSDTGDSSDTPAAGTPSLLSLRHSNTADQGESL